jgi:hypothetical protein
MLTVDIDRVRVPGPSFIDIYLYRNGTYLHELEEIISKE